MSQFDITGNNPADRIFSDEIDNTSSFTSPEELSAEAEKVGIQFSGTGYSNAYSQATVTEVRNNILLAENFVIGLLMEIEENLKKVNINPYSSPELDIAHSAVWKDAEKKSAAASQMEIPDHISYAEYSYASEHQCRSCRELIRQFDLTISHTTYGYLVDIRKVLIYLKKELTVIKNISIHHIKGEYKNETEGEVARHMSDWATAVSHYTQLLAKEMLRIPEKIPNSELDKISKKQAAQFEAFFALKVNSYLAEAQRMANLIKRDSYDTVMQFYRNYLIPAMSFKSDVVEPLLFDFNSTSLSFDCPVLNEEMVVANNAITGNLGSISADFLQRIDQMSKRMTGFIQSIFLKRKYVNYIVQLEKIATKRPKVLIEDLGEKHEEYRNIFNSLEVDSGERESLRSAHSNLDDLDLDAHPQYLRRDGGTITGDINLENGAKIAGVDISTHSHSGADGSALISSSSIDFEEGRLNYYDLFGDYPYSNLRLVSLTQSNTIGGGVYFDATFEIFIEDDKSNSYEFEILYNEV